MDRSVLDGIQADALKELLPIFLAGRVEQAEPASVQAHVSDWSLDQCQALLDTLRTLGDEHRVYPADPSCRALSRAWMPEVLSTTVDHIEHLRDGMGRGKTLIVTNHISYVDAVATDLALAASGHPDIADRIVYLAGPKVYQELFRLVAAASIHSLPVPQSNSFSHTENIAVRELARRAMSSVQAGQQALDAGQVLLFYPEGSRTRTGRLGSFLKATRRYVQAADFVVPATIVGTDEVMPLESGQMTPGPVALTFAPPIDVRAADSARDVLVAAHSAIASLLPDARRPLPDTPPLL